LTSLDDSRLAEIVLLVNQQPEHEEPIIEPQQPEEAFTEITIDDIRLEQPVEQPQRRQPIICSVLRVSESFNSLILLFFLATTIGLFVCLMVDNHRSCVVPLKVWAIVQTVCQLLVIICMLYYQYRLLRPHSLCGLYLIFWFSRLLHFFLFCWMIVGIIWLAEASGEIPEPCSKTMPHVFQIIIVVLSGEAVAVLVLILLAFCCFSFVCVLCGMYALFIVRSTPQGATQTRINKLPKRVFDANSHNGGEDLTCSICYSDYVVGEEIRLLPCDHSFHCQCVDEWLAINKTCPLCRRDIDIGDIELQQRHPTMNAQRTEA